MFQLCTNDMHGCEELFHYEEEYEFIHLCIQKIETKHTVMNIEF